MKKIAVFYFIILFTFTMYTNVATALKKDLIYNASTPMTDQFIATITRPEVFNETTYKRIYLVCGSTENKLIRFEALSYDGDIGQYKPLHIVSGGNTWYMDGPGVFTEQLILPKNGINKVRIVAYDATAYELAHAKNLQVSDYIITLMDKNEDALCKNGFQRIASMLSQLFR